MAKKQAPLKDESIYSVDDICSKLDGILDAIKNKYGDDAVKRASLMKKEN